MLKEWSDNEPDPPMSFGRKLAVFGFLIAVVVLAGWSLSG